MISPEHDPLKSEKLTALRANLDKQKARAAELKAERLRLTKILSPHFADVTVKRYTPEEVKANTYYKPSAPASLDLETKEAARKAEVLKRTLAGEPLEHSADTNALLEHNQRQSAAIEDAIEFLTREIYLERSILSALYCKQLKPKEATLMSRICKSAVEAHAAWSELYELKRHLIDSEVGLRGLCLTLPEFLGAPNSKYSPLADFFRDAKRDGYISAIPVELR
jgi:hypothetical protein